jgi:hypothetical protein
MLSVISCTTCIKDPKQAKILILNYFTICQNYYFKKKSPEMRFVYNHMINRVGKMCVAAMSLCMIALIVTRKRGDGFGSFVNLI